MLKCRNTNHFERQLKKEKIEKIYKLDICYLIINKEEKNIYMR